MVFITGSGRFPWRRKWKPTPVFLPGKFRGQRSLAGCSPQGYKELDMTSRLKTHTHTQELYPVHCDRGFPGSSAGEESASNARDPRSIPGLGRFPWRRDNLPTLEFMGFPGSSESKESACNVGDQDSIPGLGRSPGGRYGNPLQYSCLKNPQGQKSLVGYSPWSCKELDTIEQLSTHYLVFRVFLMCVVS